MKVPVVVLLVLCAVSVLADPAPVGAPYKSYDPLLGIAVGSDPVDCVILPTNSAGM